MERMVRKEFVLAVGSCLIAILFAGCEEQNLATVKKSKLIAYENRQLKEQIAQQEKKIEDQRAQQEKKCEEQLAQQEKKCEEQNKLLGECQQRKEVLEKRFDKAVDARTSTAMEIFRQATEQIKQENDELRAKVGELKAQVSKLEQELKKSESPAEPQSLTP